MSAPPLLEPGVTCWRRLSAERVAFLVDGEQAFGAIADALERARRQVWLVGWDFHTDVRLRRDDAPREAPAELAALLDRVAERREDLRIRVLAWDYALLYALERQFLPLLQFGLRTHERVRCELDDAHPLGGSQHQKIVVVDDRIAFVGGFDLTTHRWDTREHRADDPRRTLPGGDAYPPFHDVHVAVDGPAAAALAELARERWLRAVDEEVEPCPDSGADPWPPDLEPAVRDVEVGIARTLPAYGEREEVREVEALYLRSLEAARHCVYIENQYLTAYRFGERLAERLRDADGPEVVIVVPKRCSGWLEESTMGVLRARLLERLRDADLHGRLAVYHPVVPGVEEGAFNVHAKVMVVDDRLVRVGSSNLSNRSMGVDSECDVAVHAGDDRALRRALRAFRDDLVAEHLGCAPAELAEAVDREGSLRAAIESLRGEGRSLVPLDEDDRADWAAEAVAEIGLADPEYPLPLEDLVSRFTAETSPADPRRWRNWTKVAAVAGVLVALALLWRATPLAEYVQPDRLRALAAPLREGLVGPVLATLAFAAASLLMVPVTGLVVAAALLLGPWLGFGVSVAGSVLGAILGHQAGSLLWRDTVRRLAGDRLNAISRRLGERGILSTVVIRLVPVAPFTVVNMVAGASHVSLRDFAVGTGLGIAVGAFGLSVAADRIAAFASNPSAEEAAVAVGVVAAAVALVWAARRLVLRANRGQRGG